MQSASILDKILTTKQASDLHDLDPIALTQELIGTLPERERDVVQRRFGLREGAKPATLEEIGSTLKVTRERVRQIVKAAVARLRSQSIDHASVRHLATVTEHLLRSYGGALEERFFVRQLLDFSGSEKGTAARGLSEISLVFLIDHVLGDLIERRPATEGLRVMYALAGVNTDTIARVAQELTRVVDDANVPLPTDELLARFRGTTYYRQEREHLVGESIRIAREFAGTGVAADAPFAPEEEDRVLKAYLAAAAELEHNIFHEWGRRIWPTVSPKRMNDKLYLILRREGKPLHFSDITVRVNDAQFDRKVAKAPSVHNELILDDRFVLVGRGTYALKEWGYRSGTVADVIELCLKEFGRPCTREEIVAEVLKRRLVKRQTVHLALLNRGRFDRTETGHYTQKETNIQK